MPTFYTYLLLLLAGLTFPLGLAPYFYWIIPLCSLSLLLVFIQHSRSSKHTFYYVWVFSFGKFVAGVSWVYISIHEHSHTPALLAIPMVAAFAAFLALVPALCFALWRKFFYSPLNWLSLPAVWFLSEWLRTWLLTGFPWLFAGDAHLFSWLSGLAPIIGSLGLSVVSVLSVSALLHSISTGKIRYLSVWLLWVVAYFLQGVNWTQQVQTLKVSAVQGNIAQEIKWQRAQIFKNMQSYFALSEPVFNNDLIVWPETAMTLWHDQFEHYQQPLDKQAKHTHTTVITGIPYRQHIADSQTTIMHNSVVALGTGSGLYHKQKLVPFGEFVPLAAYLRGLIPFFDIEMSSFLAGNANQALLQGSYQRNAQNHTYQIAPFICYEIAYPILVSQMARQAQLLITISNDAWFGDSIGPKQHMALAQMRALETERYLVRATNTGISAVVNDKGHIIARLKTNVEGVVSAEVQLKQGQTPFMRWGVYPLLIFSALVLLLAFARRHTSKLR